MDLTPLTSDPDADVAAFTTGLLRRTETDVKERIARLASGRSG